VTYALYAALRSPCQAAHFAFSQGAAAIFKRMGLAALLGKQKSQT